MIKLIKIDGLTKKSIIIIDINFNFLQSMVRSTPLLKKRIEHKRTARFTRFQSDLYGGRLAPSWRRPRGRNYFIQVSTTE